MIRDKRTLDVLYSDSRQPRREELGSALSGSRTLNSRFVSFRSGSDIKDFKIRRLRTTGYGRESISGLGRDTSVFSSHAWSKGFT